MSNWTDSLLKLQLTWRDGADIVIVAVIIFYILSLLQGTRAMHVTIGLVLLGSSFFVARAFNLPALEAISREILFYLPFAVIILFQDELRRGLAGMGGNPLFALFRRRRFLPFNAILDACDILASKRIGALIAIEGSQALRAYEEGARAIDGLVTAELIISIFTPGAPLHDGAVIVRADRIVVAGALLPLTTSQNPMLGHGTRHRAALGLSEESDALVVVVSEENGSIAVAMEGRLLENVDRAMLHAELVKRFEALR